jgi:thiamine biosynthesis lipoprotein
VSVVSSVGWKALGTDIVVLTVDGDPEVARGAVADLLDEVDRTYSRFRADSELQRLNEGGGRETQVSPLLGLAIETALRGGRLSDSLVDPTVGRAMRAIGYDVDFDRIDRSSRPYLVRIEPIPGWQTIRYDPGRGTVVMTRGTALDLGSTGKALAADLCAAAAFKATGRGGALVSLGGDIALAGLPPEGGWRVLAAESSSTSPDADGEVIALVGGAVATSGTVSRRWTRGGVVLHHLIDPRTALPVESPWRTASVIAGTCVDANIAATAAIIKGDDAIDWLERIGLPCRLVSTDGTVHRIGGWPQPATALAPSLDPDGPAQSSHSAAI